MRLVVARVGRPHGIRGEVTVELHTDEPEERLAAGCVLFTAEDGGASLQVADARWHQHRLLLRFADVHDRNDAERLRGQYLHAEIDAAARPADEAEWYDHQLAGLVVHDPAGTLVGSVSDVVHLPGQDLLEITVSATGARRLVPFVAEIVTSVDVAAGVLVVADRPGLLQEEADGLGEEDERR